MEKRILLPTDFSDNSWSAIVYALKLYKDEVCTFYFLNSTAINAPIMTYTSNILLKTIHGKALKEMLEFKDMAEKSNANSNHKFDIIISSEDLNEAIERAINKYDIDLIIMGTLGASHIGEFLFGTNTVHLVNNIRACPVLILPEEFDFVEPKQIAFPTDFNHFYSERELEPLLKLADLFNAKIRVVHINVEKSLDELQNYNLIVLKSYLHNYEHSFHWMPDYAKITTEINDFISDLNIDVLAMVNYKHGFIEKIIKEPVIKKIGIQPQVPFLVIPE